MELNCLHSNVALCSSAPRCVETADLFLKSVFETVQQDDSDECIAPQLRLRLQDELYDGTMQPAGSRLFAEIGYAPIRAYLANENLDNAEAAKTVLGSYARSSLGIILRTASIESHVAKANVDIDKTLLFFAHAVYLPSAALALAAAIGCHHGMGLMLDTNTKEAEGYCIDIDNKTVSLLCRHTAA